MHFIAHISKTFISLLSDGLGMSTSQVGLVLIICAIFLLVIQVLLTPRVSTSYISASDTTLFRVVIWNSLYMIKTRKMKIYGSKNFFLQNVYI